MHIQHEPPHRHGGHRAIGDQRIPISGAVLGHILHKGTQQIMGVGQVDPTRVGDCRQFHRLWRAFARQSGAHFGQQAQFLLRRGGGVVSDVVRRPRKSVKAHDRRACIGAHQPAGDGEIFLGVVFAGCEVVHLVACARPFHMPPRPR